MLKLLSGLISLFVYFSIGTILVQAVAAVYLWQHGQLNSETLHQITQIMYGLEAQELAGTYNKDSLADHKLTHPEIQRYRSKMTLNQDLRESSLIGGADDLKHIEAAFTDRRRRFDRLRGNFEDRLTRLQGAASDQALVEVRETIKSLRPEQAADQIVRMLQLSEANGDPRYRDDMVTILKTLPPGIQKKVLAEFKPEARAPYLYDMLTQLRLGRPDIDVIRQARGELRQYRQRSLDPGVP